MKSLIKISKWIFVLIFIVLLLSTSFLIFIFHYEIEDTIDVKLYTKNVDETNIYVKKNINYININSKLKFNFNNNFYTIIVKDITFDENLNLFKITFKGAKLNFYPNLEINAKIIIGSKKIFEFLFY